MKRNSHLPVLLTTQPGPDPKSPPDCEQRQPWQGKKLSAPSASRSLGSAPHLSTPNFM